MTLHLVGHDYQHAAVQMMLSLFPGTKPGVGEDEVTLTLSEDGAEAVGTAQLWYNGRAYSGTNRAPSPVGGKLERDRVCQRVLKNAFYEAGVAALGQEPPWGSLTGVRPVKLPTKALANGLSEAEADRQLAQVYHVSAPRRALAMDCARASLAAKGTLEPRDVSLYLGIPFCPTRCAYCSFVSSAVGRTLGMTEDYVEALCREVRAAGKALARAGRSVKSAYMGGGTPTTLTADQLERLLTCVEESIDLGRCAEFTVEAGRPDTITEEKLAVLRRHGIGRISVNPQTLQGHVLRAIGRDHTADEIYAAWDLTRRAGFSVVNMDLIAGLPADSVAGFRTSLDGVIALGPENITVHTLALKKGSRLLAEGGSLPAPDDVAAMLDYAWQTLRAVGYVPYYLYRQKYMSGGFENVGWCRPGDESLYNICMMEELHTIVSLGAGGITKLIDTHTGSLQRLCNAKYPKEYIETIQTTIAEKEDLTWPIS